MTKTKPQLLRKAPFLQAMSLRTSRPHVSAVCVALCLLTTTALPVFAQSTPPTPPVMPAAAAQDPLAAFASPKAEGDDVLITNASPDAQASNTSSDAQASSASSGAQATPSTEKSAEQPPAELSPVEGAAATPPVMPTPAPQTAAQSAAAPEATVPATSAPAASVPAEAAAAPVGADPLAPFRAQQAIREAEARRASGADDAALPAGAANPLGPAAALPLGAPTQSPEELQAQLERDTALQEERAKKKVFDQAMESLLPLTPDQTRSVLEGFRGSREAAETPIAVPTARTTVENVSLDPSQPPLSIKTSPGYVTTLTILDMTGAPWAIQDVSWAGKFEVTTPEEGGHVIRITPMSAHGVGNISIRLVDLITPITFSIDTGLDVVDYRFDARIPKAGPLAKTPLIAPGGLTTVAGTDENLMRVLDGTAVAAAEHLALDGVDGSTTAYKINDAMYLRTPLTLLSPSWISSATSADGMNVYTLKSTPVILLSDKGRMVKARLKAPQE